MQKAFQLFFIATVLSGATGVKAQDTEDFKPSGRLFGLLFTNYHNTFSGGRSIAVFEVNRAFFGYDYAFSKTISGRILYDGTPQVYSGKSMITGYLRNAYLQYDNGKITVRGGLITPEQVLILEKFWTYRYLFPPFIERTGMAFSAEPGASFKYKPSELVAMDFALLNGRGFRDVLPDTTLRVAAGITLNPAKKLFFRGYIDAMGPSGRLQWTAGFMGAYRREKFYLGVECLYQHNHLMTDGDNYSAVSAFGSLILGEKTSLFGRYENISSVIVSGETIPWNISKDGNTVVLGLEYLPVRNVRIAPNINCFVPDDESIDFRGMIGLNVEAAF